MTYEVQKTSADESLPLIGDDAIQAAERRIENVRKIKALALRVTNQRDWVDLGGNPYLQESGVMKVAQLFRVSFDGMDVEERRLMRGDREVIQYVARVTAHYGDQAIQVEGIASSDDKFFGLRDGAHRSLDDIDLDSVRKKALTNAQSRGLKKILGLGGMTWEDVQTGGVDRSRMAGVAYGDGTRGGKKRGQQAARQATGEDAGSLRAQLKAALVDISDAEGKPIGEVLRGLTTFVDNEGKEHYCTEVSKMSAAWAGRALEKAKAYIDSMMSPQEPPAEEAL